MLEFDRTNQSFDEINLHKKGKIEKDVVGWQVGSPVEQLLTQATNQVHSNWKISTLYLTNGEKK